MTFEEKLAWQIEELMKNIIILYHLSQRQAEQQLKASAFYRHLVDVQTGWWNDSLEKNFQRYQNEVEYGAWNKDGHGGDDE